MTLDDAIGHAIDGHAILFVGAGFSRGAVAINGQSIPTGSELAGRLLAACGRNVPSGDLPAAARYFERQKTRDELASFIRDAFSIQTVTLNQTTVSSVKWRRIYTTNYDDVLETVYQGNKKPLIPVTLSKPAAEFAPRENICVHLNGFVRGLQASDLDTELKLTTVSYLSETVATSTWSYLFRSDIRAARAVIFLGYSMYDLDIQRVAYIDEATRRKCHLVVEPEADEVEISDLADFGEVHAIGLEVFVEQLNARLQTHKPAEEEELFLCFERIAIPSATPTVRDEDVLDLFLKGDLKPELVWRAISGTAAPFYYLVRDELKSVLDALEARSANVVLHAEFGNGKTAFVAGFVLALSAAGETVYLFNRHGRTFSAEINVLARATRPTVVFIENYPRVLDEVRQLFVSAGENVRTVVTARTLDHELFGQRLGEFPSAKELLEFNINKLTPQEDELFVDVLDTHGLWGDKAGMPHHAKLRCIRGRDDSEFRNILLDILRSPQIIQKLQELTAGLDQDTRASEMISALCVLDVMQFVPSFDLIAELIDSTIARRSEFQRSPVVQRFISMDRGQVTMRSSVMARHFLTEILPPDQTVEVLLKMAKRSEIAASIDPAMKSIFRLLHAYSNVQFMLPEKNRRQLLIRYYEQLKNLSGCAKNMFFWLQYAIARLSFQDYETAGRYFDTAYGLAKGRSGFDTFQIDNHFARYRLERCIYENDIKGSFSAFQDAKQILNRQMLREHRYYPYRVLRHYFDLYATYFQHWTEAEQKVFLAECSFAIGRIDKLKGAIRNHHYVVDAGRRLSEILSRHR